MATEAQTGTSTRPRITITVSKDAMSASLLLRTPSESEDDVTVAEILEELANAGVQFGVDEGAISKAVSELIFNTPITVASGLKPEKGVNSSFVYSFNTDADHRPKEDEDGNIDYKAINFIQNVEKGSVLVTKVPPTPGRTGMTVLGKELAGIDGRDLPFKNGANTKVSDDGTTLLATASGAVQYSYGTVAVKDVLTISGDVDHSVGNIDCLGSVKVTGSIMAGFTVRVDGDLEVNGNIQDCNIEVGGSIYVKGGFFGEGKGMMMAGGDITVKFAEGQRMIAGHDVNIGGEIINCQVLAKEHVTIKGKRGKIVGGEVKAGKKIRAAILGSDAGTPTHLTVGYDH
ncbi:MAG: FapA family protein, partial [candidate division Zixibacteria bacterium]|nr:FapA family protein [candidate division Zixibacteria bacterium]